MKTFFQISLRFATPGPRLLVGILLLLLAPGLRAGSVEHMDYRLAQNLSAGQSHSLTDWTYYEEVASPASYKAVRENQVRLVYGRDERTDVDGSAWTYKVVYQVFFSGVNAAPRTDTLQITMSGGNKYADAHVYNPGGYRFRIRIVSILASQGTPLNDIRLELRTVTERYTQLNPASQLSLSWDDTDGILHWPYQPGAESYELEWSWIDEESGFDPANAFERAVRVNVPGHYYQPHLTYRPGIVYFRVRPVGRYIDGVAGDYSYRRYGAWSAVVSDTISQGYGHETYRNYAYSATYAEDGKFKKVLSYVDGVGRTRQSLTHLSSDSTTVVTQTEYDREGRAVIATIPIPFRGIDLKYYDDLNLKFDSTSVAFNPFAYDDIRHNPANSQFRLSSTGGAARYFSSSNNVGGLLRDYIPDAQGYPYTQVEFKRDATGRVARQGGVGPDHQLGSGHEARFFYGDATRTEMYRMFGGNVGNANHYQKKMSVDPNGQLAFVWQDQEGRVVATALAGDAPDNVLELTGINVIPITENLDSNRVIDHEAGISYHQHTLLNELPNKQYDFHYDMSGVIDPLGCLCMDCEYVVEITVRGPDGALVPVDASSTPGISIGDTVIYDTLRNASVQTCPPFIHGHTLEWSMELPEIGDYKVSKTLRALPGDELTLAAALLACPGSPGYEVILNSLLSGIDTTVCDPVCPDSFPIFGRVDMNLVSIVGWDTAAGFCNGSGLITPDDIRDGECEGIYRRMVDDISPGGWLHDASSWSGIAGDTAAIRNYLKSNHREYCHYLACREDAHSKWWDVQMAAAPTMSFAVDHNLIDTFPAADSLVDPWFDNSFWNSYANWSCPGGLTGNQNRPADAFRDSLFAWTASSPGYRNSGLGVIDYFNPAVNTSQDMQDLYTEQCGSSAGPGFAACKDTLWYILARGAYLDVKLRMQIDYNDTARCCGYYDDARAIVPPPLIPAQALADPDAWNSARTASLCNSNCAGSVEVWVNELMADCPSLTSTDSLELTGALMAFCLGTCPDGNPQALITDTYLSSGQLSAVESILAGYSCDNFLDSLAVPDPYVYTSGTDTIKTACTLWDPCFVALADLHNSNWPLASYPGTISFDDQPVLQYCYPDSAGVQISTGMFILDSQGSPDCELIRLYDSVGTQIPLSQVKRMSALRYEATLPPGLSQTMSGLDYQDIALRVSIDAGGAPWDQESVRTAYVYSGCGNFSVSQDSCLRPQMTLDTVWNYDPDPQAQHDSCVANIIREVEYQAQQIYLNATNDLLNSFFNEFHQQCLRFPFEEHFRYTHSPKVYQYTLYYFDQAGQLTQTVPPEGVELLDLATARKWEDGTASRSTDMPDHRMPTRYRYNSLGQLRRSNTPDGGETVFYYNDKDQIRLVQDARQEPNDQWAYTKYDALGRTVETGQIENYQGTIDAPVLNDFDFPGRANETLTDIVTTVHDTLQDPAHLWQTNLRTRVAATVREDAEGDTVSVCHYAYDEHGNVHRTQNDLRGLGAFDLEYSYDLVSGNVNRVLYQHGRPDYFSHKYRYDADNRLVAVSTTRDNVFWDEDARYFYYAHGPLARLEIGEDNVQGYDHLYSIHGWIKGVNMPGAQDGVADPGNDGDTGGSVNQWAGRDAMAYHLGFYEGDYQSIGTVSLGHAASLWSDLAGDILDDGATEGLFNGNIAAMVTDLHPSGTPPNFISGGLANAYQYDQLNRIKQMQTWYRSGGAWIRPGSSGIYKATFTYDKNGNLDSLVRRVVDRSVNPWGSQSMDALVYHYPLSGGEKVNNRLDHVDDGVPLAVSGDITDQNPGNYSYDAIGNITANAQEEIDNIGWDLYNKIRTVERTTNGSTVNHRADLRFWYDGMGNRIRKRVIQPLAGGGADTTDTWYVRDPQGNPMAIYEQERVVDTLFTKVSEFAIYGAERTSSGLSARIGLCYADQLIRRECLSEQCASLEDEPVSTLRMLLVSEVMYDSPVSPDSLPFEEVHNGEYLRIANSSGREMSLDSVRLVCNGDTLALNGTLGMEEVLLLGFAADAGEFHQITRVDTIGEDLRLVLQQSLALPDGGGEIEVWYGDSLVDRVLFGEFHGLVAENAYLSDTLLDSLGQRSSLTILSRQTGSGRIVGPPVIGGSIGPISIGGTIQAEPVIQSWQGRYGLYRGRKAYEGTNHLGNVLAVVSDLKLGQESGTPDGVVDYYLADVVSLSDYWPFGAPLQERQFSAKDYRYGFNGKESDPKWMGKGNAIDYGFRVQDARVGRFMSVDPLAPEYPDLTCYQFASNSPVANVDLDGLEKAGAVQAREVEYAPGMYTSANDAVKTISQEAPIPFFDWYTFAPNALGRYGMQFQKYYPLNEGSANWGEIAEAIARISSSSGNYSLQITYDLIDDSGILFQTFNPFDNDVRHLNGAEALPVDKQQAFISISSVVLLSAVPSKARFDITRDYMENSSVSQYIREIEAGHGVYSGEILPGEHVLSKEQLNALKQNLKQTLTKTIPNAKTPESIQNQLNRPRWKFIDQIEGGREAVDEVIGMLNKTKGWVIKPGVYFPPNGAPTPNLGNFPLNTTGAIGTHMSDEQ